MSPITSATAPALEPQAHEMARPIAGPQLVSELPRAIPVATPVDDKQPEYQASLFGPMEVAAKPAASGERKHVATPRAKRDKSAQRSLDFTPPVSEGSRALQTSVEAAIYCDAPVAPAMFRVVASVVDYGIALGACGIFLATLQFSGEDIVVGKQTAPVLLALAGVIILFYRLLFCLTNRDTPGMLWTGLRLLNFDGHAPSQRERLCRMGGGVISAIAAGLGLLWALVDEERLTWHDHMSETFPTLIAETRQRQF